MNEDLLQQIGLNKSEVKVYLTLLELGSSTTGPVMDKAKISSSKIYGILARLMEKGLVSFVIKGRTRYYHASTPEALLDYINEKESRLKKQEEQLKKLIPELKSKQKLMEHKQDAHIYVGWKSIMNGFNFILDYFEEGDDYIAFAQTSAEEEAKEVKLFFSQYQKKREGKKLKVKLIAPKSQKKIFNSLPYSKFKNFNVKYVENCPSGIIISKDHIYISTFEISPVGIIISSKEIADSFRNYFYAEWKIAEKG